MIVHIMYLSLRQPYKASYCMERLIYLKYWRWGFVFCNSLARSFQLMNHVLEPYINDFAFVYLDYVCIYYYSIEYHIPRFRHVLQKLREHLLLIIRMPKCFWGRRETEYLGVIVGNGALRTTPDKIAVVHYQHFP